MSSGFFGMPRSYAHEIRREAQADVSAREAASHAREAARASSEVERRLDKLTLICMAMWSFLGEKLGLSEEDLMERVQKLDLMDGAEDGKIQRQLAQCPRCNRTMSPRHTRCLYCGAERLKLTAFDDVV